MQPIFKIPLPTITECNSNGLIEKIYRYDYTTAEPTNVI